MSDQKLILVTGATGKQGGATARHLLRRGYRVRALTRNPDKPEARALTQAGADVVRGDLDDRTSLEEAVIGCYGVFSVQNFWETGYDREIAQGKRLADVAASAGVGHFVYTSVGGANRDSGLEHFESKWLIEQHVRSLGMPWTVFRPVWFMDNWEGDAMKNMILGGVLYQPLSPSASFQQIATDDVGFFAAEAFDDRDAWLEKSLEIAGDDRTMPEIAAAFSAAIGKEVTYQQIPWEDFRAQAGEEYYLMYRWFEEHGYEADVEVLRRIHSRMRTFEAYLDETGWGQLIAKEQARA